jgi:hypothetical protein
MGMDGHGHGRQGCPPHAGRLLKIVHTEYKKYSVRSKMRYDSVNLLHNHITLFYNVRSTLCLLGPTIEW